MSKGASPATWKLPPATLQRLQALYAQRQLADSAMQQIMSTAVEVLGLEGPYDVDLATGTLRPKKASENGANEDPGGD